MNADYLEIRQAYLAHYKTKGAKNGIRRFQSYEVAPNPSGFVGQEVGEAAKQRGRVSRKEMNSYDLKNSEKYKNATASERRKMAATHTNRSYLLGKKAANRIAYKEHELGKDGRKETAKELVKQVAIGAGLSIGLPIAVDLGVTKIRQLKARNDMANVGMDTLASMKGLNVVDAKDVGKAKFASIKDQFNYLKKGKQAAEAVTNSEWFKKQRRQAYGFN